MRAVLCRIWCSAVPKSRGLAQQLREHAERAPHHAGADQLRAVAEQQDQVVQLLQDALTARDETPDVEPKASQRR